MRWMLVLLFSVSFPAIAQVYKWTDENGNVHFGSQPPPGQQERVETRPGYQPSTDQPRAQSHIMRQAQQLEQRERAEEYRDASEKRRAELDKAIEEYENRPDYICQGAKDRVKSAKERWEAKKLQGYSIDDERYYEQLIRNRERHRDNVCR